MAFAARVGRTLPALAVQALLQDRALTVSAAGTTQAAATALSAAFNVVTTCVLGANGVVLPTADPGDEVTVANNTTETLYVYPSSGGAINGQTANIPVAVAAGRACSIRYITTVNCTALF